MPLAEVQINIRDPGLGVVPASAGKTQVKIGVSQAGTANAVYAAGSTQAAKKALGSGPLLEAVLQVLSKGGGPVLFVPASISSYGTVAGVGTGSGLFKLEGAGTGTVTGSRGPENVVRVKVGTGGALGVATFQVAIGAGSAGYGPLVTTGADPYTYTVPGQAFTKLAFAAGTYVAGDIYTLQLDGTVSRTGSGTATLLDGSTNSPVDAYDIWVQIMTPGGLGAGTFRYSLDAAETVDTRAWTGSIGIPAGGKFVIPGTGIVLTFAGTFTLADVYKGTATAAGYTVSEFNTAANAILVNPSEWGLMHAVGKPANAAGALTLAAAMGAIMDTARAGFRFVRGVVECPQEEGDTTIKTTFANFVHDRVGVVVGDHDLVSIVSGRTERRSLAWSYMARLSGTKLSIHPGQLDTEDGGGPLRGVTRLYRDEFATPGLDDARFVTAQTYPGYPGYYIVRGMMMAQPGSDYEEIQNCRVMDRAATIIRSACLPYLNKPIRIDSETGGIYEPDAQGIEAMVEQKLRNALLGSEDEASAANFTVSRTDDILATKTMSGEGDITPKGYPRTIRIDLGFVNPALQAAAAA